MVNLSGVIGRPSLWHRVVNGHGVGAGKFRARPFQFSYPFVFAGETGNGNAR
jgi:hypothetical protein